MATAKELSLNNDEANEKQNLTLTIASARRGNDFLVFPDGKQSRSTLPSLLIIILLFTLDSQHQPEV